MLLIRVMLVIGEDFESNYSMMYYRFQWVYFVRLIERRFEEFDLMPVIFLERMQLYVRRLNV